MKIFTKKRVWLGILVIFIGVVIVGGIKFAPYLGKGPIGVGIKAKILCSGVFVSGREAQNVIEEDLSFHPLFKIIKWNVDHEAKEVTTSLLGLIKNKAVYHDKLGAVLLSGADAEEIRSWDVPIPEPLPINPEEIPWPTGNKLSDEPPPDNINIEQLNKAVNSAFDDLDPDKPWRTRAVIVVKDGRVVAERYANGITRETPLIGWSMSKSVTSALVGILVGQGKLSLEGAAPVPEWNTPDDPRNAITIDQLLRMSSGLEFEEEYETKPVADVNRMFFTKQDMDAFAASFPLETEPNGKWSYSSGTTNILAGIIQRSFDSMEEYLKFPREALFNKLGMRSAVFETDATGMFVGAAYVYACARDWARFGLLYLNDGVWEGERILPDGWVQYTATPTPKSPKGNYGAQFWLNKGFPGNPETREYPALPQEMIYCYGYQGQYTVIIPSMNLVIVRLGMDTEGALPFVKFMTGILDAVE